MKWQGGPIVAKSKIHTLDSGEFTSSTVEQIRALCKGTNLYDLKAYWDSVREKGSGYFTVIRLRDEEWLEQPIEPAARSYGPWVYLDSDEKKKA
jgi:hypothetical protein